jgi:hypothetical protein
MSWKMISLSSEPWNPRGGLQNEMLAAEVALETHQTKYMSQLCKLHSKSVTLQCLK